MTPHSIPGCCWFPSGSRSLPEFLFSLAPVWQSRRVEVNEALKEGSRGTASLSKLRIGRLLVVLQVALSVLLLAGAGLCVKTFTNLRNMPLGLRPEGVLLFTLDPPRLRYPADRIGALLTQLQERLRAIPGVQSATFSGTRAGTAVATGNQEPVQTFDTYARATDVGSRFFETMGIPILYGRAIDEHDTLNGPQRGRGESGIRPAFLPAGECRRQDVQGRRQPARIRSWECAPTGASSRFARPDPSNFVQRSDSSAARGAASTSNSRSAAMKPAS